MTMKRRHFLQLAAGTAALSALPSRAQEGLTLWGPPVAPTVLLAVAAEMGEARKIMPFSVKSWKNPDQLRAGLLNKSISMSIVPSYVAANLRAQGQPVLLHNIMTHGLLSIMSKNDKLESFHHLVGQKIVMPFKGDMPDLVLQVLANKHQVSLENMVTYTATPPESVALFLNKDFNHALLPEPLASASILRGKQSGVTVERSIKLDHLWNQTFNTQHGIPQAGLLVSESALVEHKDFLQALDGDLIRAVSWVMENRKTAAEMASRYMPAPISALELSFEHAALSAVRTKDIADEVLQFLNIMHELNPKITGGKPVDSALFST
ncbi:MAG: ABC transporter substrate-binding protein [Cardiobacteriaceae bacterium]|nr:ABC transporter substrate-binding protein [Cardiobacteriaceae bacterium]